MVSSSLVLSFYFIILQSILEAHIQKQYKFHQRTGKVTTQIHVPKEHEPELVCLVSLALFGTLGISSLPNRNFISSSCLQSRRNKEQVYASWDWRGWQHQQSTAAVWNGAVGHCGIWLAGWMSILSIWPLGENKYIVVPFYLASSKQKITLFHPTIPWCWIPCLFHFFWQKWNENLILTLAIAVLK